MPYAIPKITYGGLVPTTVSFTYPPIEKAKERLTPNKKVTASLSGRLQTQINYIEGTRKLEFSHITEAQLAALRSFYENHAVYGKAFRYYDDATALTYVDWELDDNAKFEPKIVAPTGVDTYIYSVTLDLRRVVGQTDAGGYVEQELLNNQAVALDLTGLVFDSDEYRSAKIFFEIWRKTATKERIVNGYLTVTYSDTNGWDITPSGVADGQLESGQFDHGVTFSISAAGQVRYTSDNMSGGSYEGTILLRDFTIVGG